MSEKSLLGIFIFLLLICVALLISAQFLEPNIRIAILSVAGDGFKLTLGALIGAVSNRLGSKKE